MRDVLGWPYVEHGEAEPGWLIFGTGPSELGVHPTRSEWQGKVWEAPRHVEISFMCDDVAATRAELEAKGATFQGDIADEGWGLVTVMDVPGTDGINLYQPRHEVAYALGGAPEP